MTVTQCMQQSCNIYIYIYIYILATQQLHSRTLSFYLMFIGPRIIVIVTPKLQHTSNQEQYDQCGNSTE